MTARTGRGLPAGPADRINPSERGDMPSRELQRFSETVEAIYAASLTPSLWQHAVGAIARQHHAPMANLLTPLKSPSDGGFIFSVGIPESALQLWGSKFVSHDIWARRVIERKLTSEGMVAISSDILTDQEFEESYFYQEFLKYQRIWHLCTGIVFDGSSAPLTAMSLFRPREAPSFGNLDRRLFKLTVNHVSRSLGTMLMLRNAELQVQATLASLDRFDTAVVLTSRRGNVVFANQPAKNILETRDGLTLRAGNPVADEEGWLAANDPAKDDQLKRFLRDCLDPLADTDHFNRGLMIVRPSGKRPYVVRASALSVENEMYGLSGNAGAIVFITDPERTPTVSTALLQRVYGLTSAEANLAQELLRGIGLVAVAKRLGISNNTAKTQLAAVYEKSGTHRQAELVKLLFGLASNRIDRPPKG